jgi:hypothetical protein
MPTPTETGEDKPGDETATPATSPTSSPKTPATGKPLIGRTAAVGIGIGSAALVAALLYASRSKPGSK